MRTSTSAVAFATISQALATFQGFNYASTFNNNAAKQQADFEAEFKAAAGLTGAPATFNSARLYTTIQAGTTNDVISAIPAAISTKTSLLLGLWASGGDAAFANELAALKTAISQHGSDLGPLVAGISVGSEDLYRISPTGVLNHENPGVGPDVLASYIKQVRDLIAGTALSGAAIGHVDTWTAWVNGSNKATIDAVDWVGVDAYPYFQDTQANSIDNAKGLFNDAFSATAAAVGGKPVWVTETGHPVSGKTVGQSVPGLDNAKKYWDDVGCALFGKTNTWWYTLHDADPSTPNPSFGIVGSTLSSTPLFDLSCSNVSTSSSSSAASTATSTSTATGSGSGSGSGSSSSSSSQASTTATVPTSLGGGSPGATINSSQLSLETKTTSAGTGAGSQPTASSTGTGSSGGSGSGSGSNSTVPSSTPKASTSAVTTPNGAVSVSGSSLAAAFGAMMVAILAL